MLGLRLRAPRGDREILVHPALSAMPDLVARNHDALGRVGGRVLGLPFQDVRQTARQHLCPGADLIIQTGHQPTLYHPGVWIKNFLAFKLADRVGGAPLNLVVDNDAAKHLEIAVPHMAADGSACVRRVPLLDRPPLPEMAYEETPAPPADHLGRVAREVRAACHNDDIRAGFDLFWRLVEEEHRPGQSIAGLITAARHRLEIAGGIDNQEVPVSAVSASEPFQLLLLHILSRLRDFVGIHNAVLADYRRAHRIRNRANPVPDLRVEGDLLELPYWAWRAGEPRDRLTARLGTEAVQLRRDDEVVLESPAAHLLDAGTGPDLLRQAEAQGWKIRPRALSTTIFCRLFVADVFIHGIGGAIYDAITDEIIRRFFEVEPPPYVVCSATVRLPVPTHGATPADLRREQHHLRDLTYNPDRYLDGDEAGPAGYGPLIARKRALIARPRGTTAFERREIFLNIRRVNASMMEGVADRAAAVRRRIPELERQIAADALLGSREYAFCLFPPGVLPAFYDQALAELAS